MKTPILHPLGLLWLATICSNAQSDPRISAWFTQNSGQYARIYQTSAAQTAGTTSTTWSRGSGTQSLPTYSDVSEICYSANWVYIRTTGLASHVMGPWYIDAAKTTNFPNFPSNNAVIYRIPRTPTVPGSKTSTGLGAIGRFVNGVSFFDNRDAYSYVNASATDATPINGLTGDGIWNRDAYVNELVTFDPALAHQAGNNYHYHVQPVALRHQLGDHVDYNPATKTYSESATPVTKHSPILAWAADGYPVYGPYGYSDPTNPNSGVRRMISGFVPRNGSFGTANLTTTGRTTLPAWAAAVQGRSTTLAANQYGPAVNATYTLGHYIEDNDFLGDRGYTRTTGSTVRDYDLDVYNGRSCVTPEFPGGTYAYFSTLDASGNPAFPYNIGRQYYGSPTGGAVTSITETVTTTFKGGPNKTEAGVSAAKSGGNVTYVWSAVEGGTYTVQASSDLSGWTNVSTTAVAAGGSASVTETGAASFGKRFYRAARTALASFDSTGFNYTQGGTSGGSAVTAPGGTVTRGQTYTVTVNIPTNNTPPAPPATFAVNTLTVGGSATGVSGAAHPSQYVVTFTYAVPAGASIGAKDIVMTFTGAPPTLTLSGYLTVN